MTEPDKPIPSLYEWTGGEPAIRRPMDCVHDSVERDDLVGPRFFSDGVSEDHRAHVTAWWSEVLGHLARYTEELGGYEGMLAHNRRARDHARAAHTVRNATVGGIRDATTA
jgi:hemoglobin